MAGAGGDAEPMREPPATAQAVATATTGAADRPLAPAARVHRFARTERWLHAAHGTAFLLMLATGLALFLPFLAQVFGNRPVVKAIHLGVAALWLTALLLIAILGDRGVLRRTRRQFESLDRADLRWLRSRAARSQPQGRFNGGQKLHAVVQAALSVLFVVSGALLWLGERNTDFRLPGTLALHDAAMVIATAFVAGHVWIATSRDARPSLSGMTDGTVPASYARTHHAAWDPSTEPVERVGSYTPLRLAAAAVVLAAGVVAAALLAGVG